MHAVKTYDVIIIGAGPAGIFTALELADKGFKILMVERLCKCKGMLKAFPKARKHSYLCVEKSRFRPTGEIG